MKKQYYCSNCKETIISDDAGYGFKFKKGQSIFCKKKKTGNLHYHDIEQMEEAIRDTFRGNQEYGREIRSYGKEAKVIYK